MAKFMVKGMIGAETFGEKDKWIRTRVKPEFNNGMHSSAFGPAQITASLWKEILKDAKSLGLTDEEIASGNYFHRLTSTMLNHGKLNPNHPIFGYGRTYDVPDHHKENYYKVYEKYIARQLKIYNGDPIDVLVAHRHGPKYVGQYKFREGVEKEDPDFFKRYQKTLASMMY
jgi:hypothetical protein